jgi:hypothetical protein
VLSRLLDAGDADDAVGTSIASGEFQRFVERYHLQLLVNWRLSHSPARQFLCADWLARIKAFSLKRWAAQEALVRELAQLHARLTAAGHVFILLKGAYLAERFFGGIDRRLFNDLDILVRSEELPAVERLLREAGYARKSAVLINESLTARFTHAFDFVKPNVALDLHWLLSANAAHRLDYEAIWNGRQEFVLRRQRYFVLSDEYELVFTLIAIFKDIERGAAGLKQFIDLYFILNALGPRLDWPAFFERRRKEQILNITVNILALFLEMFECEHRFHDVARAIAPYRRIIKPVLPENRQSLMEAQQGALRNKLWAAGLYDCSRAHVLVWWLASLPFRIAVHTSRKYAG